MEDKIYVLGHLLKGICIADINLSEVKVSMREEILKVLFFHLPGVEVLKIVQSQNRVGTDKLLAKMGTDETRSSRN